MSKLVVVTTENQVSIKDAGEDLLTALQDAVGGYIEITRPWGLTGHLVMIVNETGLLADLPLNALGSALYGSSVHGSPIVGDIAIVKEGYVDGERDIIGLTDVEAEVVVSNVRRIMASAQKTAPGGSNTESGKE